MEEQVLCKTRIKERGEQYLNELAQEIYETVGMEFNIDSDEQLATVLYDELKIGDEEDQINRFTDIRTLESLMDEHPVIGLLVIYRSHQVWLNRFDNNFNIIVAILMSKGHVANNSELLYEFAIRIAEYKKEDTIKLLKETLKRLENS